MSLIEIEGPPEVLRGLYDIDGLKVVERSTKRHSDTRWTVGGYATAEAIDAVRARGAAVEVLMTTDQLTQAHLGVRTAIARDQDPYQGQNQDGEA